VPPALRSRHRHPSTDDQPSGPVRRSDGAPLRLPAVADRVSEGWWRLSPRRRSTIVLALGASLTLAVLLRVALSPYGPPLPVVLATRDLAVGTRIAPSDLDSARWPASLVADHLIALPADAIGSTLSIGVPAGTPVSRRHLEGDGVSGALAAWAVAVPVPAELLPPLVAGGRIDVIITLGDGSGRAAASDVRVLSVDGGIIWLEVERSRAPDVSAAAGRGTIAAVILPG
jgi:Flp pilus assembly protein CpaB